MTNNSGRRAFIKISLSLLSTLTFYGCGGGSASSSPVGPTVLPPSIITQPSDQSVLAGDSATFQALAEGTPPLSYQWHRNGVDIPGATSSSYTTPFTATGSDALFSVTVTNSAGAVTSREAQLSVTELKTTTDTTTITADSTMLTVDDI